jgi:7,8-dihydropterin-6-yl-methyl-4-(beta-D-ribofuranosyl)aminobenzene 5'-phosphate synthase
MDTQTGPTSVASTPTGTLVLLNPEPTFEALEGAGGRVTKHAEAHTLAGFFFVSGEIERVTSYEAGFVGHHTVRDGHAAPDPLILDERFQAARVRGRGVSVLSSCSHAGVVNAALGALSAFGGEPIDVILGGYHLAGEGMEPRIEPTVHDVANRIKPRVVAPGHCTGGVPRRRSACICAGKLRAERRRLALRSARDVSGTTRREPPPDCDSASGRSAAGSAGVVRRLQTQSPSGR